MAKTSVSHRSPLTPEKALELAEILVRRKEGQTQRQIAVILGYRSKYSVERAILLERALNASLAELERAQRIVQERRSREREARKVREVET